MNFPDSYFEDEVRDGFYISPIMKSCWAAQLEVLSVVDAICKKHNIKYFAEWGTMLGCIRHGGFIPWDDDMDIAMKRMDYEKFQKIAKDELPEGYAVLNYQTEANYWDVMMRVINADFANMNPEFLDTYHNCPYASGLDIFPLDYVTRDKEEEAIQKDMVEMVKTVADSNGQGSLDEVELEEWLIFLENLTNQKIDHKGNIKNQLYKILCALYGLYGEEDGDQIALIPQYLDCGGSIYDKACYADSIRMPFDVMDIPVPLGYDSVLKLKYGDYMKNVRSGGGHDYPYHEKQDSFLEERGVVLPKYEYPNDLSQRVKNPAFKESLGQKLQLISQIHEKIEMLVNYRQNDTVLQLLQELQNLAVNIGESIEKKVGQETEAVSMLEQYCEVVFELYTTMSANLISDGAGVRAILDETLQVVRTAVDALKVPKEIVFMPYRYTHWKAIDSVWRKACEEEDCIVRVVPLPYYYKRRLGAAISELQYDGDKFPDYVPITHYLDYNMESNHPDVIYIQAPYDNWNHATTIHSNYYSTELWKNTEELVYIPWFKTDEMRPDDERALHGRKYYVTMPGVVNADKVIVQSEGMKQSYVDYLTEWAGEDTRAMWENKIFGLGSPLDDYVEIVERPAEWQDKKLLLYHISGNGLLEHEDKMIQKIQNSLDIFEAHSDKIQVLWLQDVQMRQRLEGRIPETFDDYVQILEMYQNKPWITLLKADEEKRTVQLADAFYGDAGKSAQLMKQASKPVMLQNVDV